MLKGHLVDVVPVGEKTHAIISPNKIQFVLNSTKKELDAAISKEVECTAKLELKADKQDISGITFLPTMDCNLGCIYCYAQGGADKEKLSSETAKSAILGLTKIMNGDEILIDFAGGGEPFMNFEIMKDVVSYAKKLYKKVKVRLVTNGTFNQEQLDWIIKNEVDLRVSFDGVAHETQRPFRTDLSSKKIVEGNIKKLVELNKQFKVQCVVTSKSIEQLVDSIKYFNELGAKVVKVEPVHISTISRKGEELASPRPEQFVRNFIKAIKYIIDNDLKIKLDTAFLSRPTIGYYCGLRNNIIITPRGQITGCVEFTRKTDPFSELILNGDCSIKDNKLIFDKKAKEELKKIHFTNYPNCRKCNLKLICKAGCPARNLFDKGHKFIPSDYTCKIVKQLVPEVLKLVAEDNRYTDVVFDKFQVEEC